MGITILGKENKKALEKWLFQNYDLHSIIPKEIILKYYKNFLDKDPIAYSHSISMLLALAVWSRYNKRFHQDFEKIGLHTFYGSGLIQFIIVVIM